MPVFFFVVNKKGLRGIFIYHGFSSLIYHSTISSDTYYIRTKNCHKLSITEVGIRIDKQYPPRVCSGTPDNALLGIWYAGMNIKRLITFILC